MATASNIVSGAAGKRVDQQSEHQLLQLFARGIATHANAEGDTFTEIPGLRLFHRTVPTTCTSAAYEPSLILYAQGQKTVQVGGSTYICNEGTCQLTSVDMPVFSQVTKASIEEPILAIVLKLDMTLVREVLSQQEFQAPEACSGTRGMAIGRSTPELITACMRLLDLLDAPHDIPFLAGLVEREVVYRALRSPLGKHLRAIATLGDQSNRTAKAVAWLKVNYAKPLHVEELAQLAQMAVSTFHLRFKSLTQMSPLQYQKRLRLHQARLRMMNDGLDAASAAFEVGYESASQFSREYRRFFGRPPMRDVRTQQTNLDQSVAVH
jgi:AraC-like DNA-binding protein